MTQDSPQTESRDDKKLLSNSEQARLFAHLSQKDISLPDRKPYLKSTLQRKSQPLRDTLRLVIYSILYRLVHIVFAVHLRFRHIYNSCLQTLLAVTYFHHRTPAFIQRDVGKLSKRPRHLSIILEANGAGEDTKALNALIRDMCECAAWAACAGIPTLSIYEKTGPSIHSLTQTKYILIPLGLLRDSLPELHSHMTRTLEAYFGSDPCQPTISLRAPLTPAYSPCTSPSSSATSPRAHLSITLLSATDGRQTLLDLTKTLTEMSQRNKLSPQDISVELIDTEISQSTIDEPDLVIVFADEILLQGFPPWQLRLTEI